MKERGGKVCFKWLDCIQVDIKGFNGSLFYIVEKCLCVMNALAPPYRCFNALIPQIHWLIHGLQNINIFRIVLIALIYINLVSTSYSQTIVYFNLQIDNLQSPQLKTEYQHETQFRETGFMVCRYHYFFYELLFYLVALHSLFVF